MPDLKTTPQNKSLFNASVIVAALGYFVDIYDLVLFSIVRIPSLRDLGIVSPAALLEEGVLLLNMQMAGMLIGGVIWGILGDKKGRLSVLFGSIFLYSVANIMNGFVNDIPMYAFLRFVAGLGLAGELGAGITLVSEVLPKEKRGYGTMIVATIGISGAILAGVVGEYFGWRTAYFIGGGLGLLLLFLRIGVYESGMFKSLQSSSHVTRGNFLSLFTNGKRFRRYLKCILVGIPIWYVVGILITFSPEFGVVLGVTEAVSAAKAVSFCYLGLVFGDFFSGFLSQRFKSRRNIILVFLLLTAGFVALYLLSGGLAVNSFYVLCAALGFASGYWAVFVTIAAEQFGTNIRATVTTTVPNFVRGAVVPLTLAFEAFKDSWGLVPTAMALGGLSLTVAAISILTLEETYSKDLDYLEPV
ncbi:putative MFS family arabinose efflux permease [Pontibacter ummariensis]|uniref:Predicted arabinose efflux permease, MFS family n=1 Tax=Pontibacter ummariensis TaxID=1610492 RepID=A0A239CUQ8_9BACT|nr:MFS transporter [Pontibacter ummariensis]PRY14844.1 putative MFS family arabinose efflux permease [Pontibacter ummariensis]SNS23264.1 Predicted arabinose efflux permease, MFS family [Pontibacter ummariensis]